MFLQSGDPNNWSDYGNHELWKAFQGGDRRAFSELFLRFYPALFRYGIKLMTDEEEVKDGIQKLFFSLWQKREVLKVADSVEYYLLFSLRRILFREKKSGNARDKRNREYGEKISQTVPCIEDQIVHFEAENERYILYRQALQTLNDRQREVLLLRLDYGLDNREIAAIMELSEKRVRNLICEAIKRLKEQVSQLNPSI
jgi:RNA polymerase sigma factor (sigma-70 family)